MKCPICEVEFEENDTRRCPRCGSVVGGGPHKREGLPWDHRGQIGWLTGLWQTTGLVLTSPETAFNKMLLDMAFQDYVLYFAAMTVMGLLGNYAISHMLASAFGPNLYQGFAVNSLLGFGMTLLAIVAALVIIPRILHVTGLILRGLNCDYEGTVNVYCCAVGSTSVFLIIPLTGHFIVLAYSFLLIAKGMHIVHRIPRWKARIATGVALVLPTLLLLYSFL